MKRSYCFILLVAALVACKGRSNSGPVVPVTSSLSGQELAAVHCARCHAFPAPDLLPKHIWQNGVLPEMAFRLGMKRPDEKLAALNPDELVNILKAGVYPDGPQLSEQDWQKIQQYYIQNAPEQPIAPDAAAAQHGIQKRFVPQPVVEPSGTPPMVTLVKMDASSGRIYVGRRDRQQLEILDRKLKLIDSVALSSPVSDVSIQANGDLLLLQMGIMEPNDDHKGVLLRITPDKKRETILKDLQRPVHLELADLNADGKPDYLVCEYGNETGKLAWYDGKTLEMHVLKAIPGARVTQVQDLNGDGLPDIAVLMAQAWEGISFWYNKGNGNFEEHSILQFPPVYGSSYMTLTDMNRDGYPDILYTNGDNADYSYSPKAYHGLRIFLNDGKNNFHQAWFYPVFGASKVQVMDFDGDGDPDLALIAFFPQPEIKADEGFLYFENQGDMKFSVGKFSGSDAGRWLVMDCADMHHNGRPDILLGNFVKSGLGQARTEKMQKPISLYWLKARQQF